MCVYAYEGPREGGGGRRAYLYGSVEIRLRVKKGGGEIVEKEGKKGESL